MCPHIYTPNVLRQTATEYSVDRSNSDANRILTIIKINGLENSCVALMQMMSESRGVEFVKVSLPPIPNSELRIITSTITLIDAGVVTG